MLVLEGGEQDEFPMANFESFPVLHNAAFPEKEDLPAASEGGDYAGPFLEGYIHLGPV